MATKEESIDPNIPTSGKLPDAVQNPSRRGFLKLLLGGGAAVAADHYLGGPISRPVARFVESIVSSIAMAGENTPKESAYLLPTLSEEEIKERAFIPKGEDLGNRYLHTVSPQLQERAKSTGYHLIYQEDPDDTTGRTVLFSGERSINNQYYDIGFGWWFSPEAKTMKEAGDVSIRGVFQGWVIPPDWEKGNKGVYMLLKDPIRHHEFLVRMDQDRHKRSLWVIDNLDIGGDPIPLAVYGTIHTFLSSLSKYGENSEVVEIQTAKQLDAIVRPGDIIEPLGGTVSTDRNFDKHDVFLPQFLYLRRFGGIEQLRDEINQ